ncbi:uncharacterized protein [Aphelocoma coerulescens]|uniref:uncharacterized protein n=1 Tax=Aphelocoma coerulescens TaxID=39617 RepID=UPI003604F2AE
MNVFAKEPRGDAPGRNEPGPAPRERPRRSDPANLLCERQNSCPPCWNCPGRNRRDERLQSPAGFAPAPGSDDRISPRTSSTFQRFQVWDTALQTRSKDKAPAPAPWCGQPQPWHLPLSASAALIIGAVLANAEHPRFPSSLPVEFPCIPTSDPPAADILAFARGLQSEPRELSSAQLSCLARLLAAKNLTADFGSFPPDLLLFFPPSEVRAGACREFYARASRGNLDLLPRGSSRRTRLLRGALTCLGVRGRRLEPQQLGSLGALVCDLEPATIPASGPAILDNLKLCPALTGAQQDALNALLLTGDTAYGDPSSWDSRTLQDLGPLVLALNQTTLSLVAEAAREDFRRSIVAAYSSQGHSQREKSLILLGAFAAASAASHRRLKRIVDPCLSEPITVDCIPYLTPEQLNLRLSGDFLIKNLEAVLEQPVTAESFEILKKKVDQFFPWGIPEEQLQRLGPLSRLYTEQEISQWTLRHPDTLSALLNPSGGWWTDSQVQQLLSRFLALGGSLTGPLLQQIGGKRLCNLQEEQIQQIPAEAIRTAGQLNISLCSQTKKEQFYRKAREAFAGLASSPRPYYCLIQPYLGGAPAEDLKNLANTGVDINMKLDTFLTLNPKEVQKLSVTDVKNLLGKNLPELKEAENKPLVVSWVKIQSQRELDCVLGIGLQGGLQEPTGTASPACPTTPASITSTTTVTTSPHPSTSASVTVPTPTAITSHSAPQPSTVPQRTPTPSTLSPPPPDTPTYTGGPTVPTATPTARPALTTRAPCSTHQAPTPDRATSPAVTLLTTLLAPSSPSAAPVPAVTSRATTSAGVGINPAGTTHSTVTPVPNPSSAPTATPVPHSSSAPTVTPVPHSSSAPTVTPVPHSSSAPTVTPVPNPSSVPTATHSTVTPVPNPSSSPTVPPVPHSSSAPTATHSTVTPVPNPSSAPTVTPVPNPSSAPTATHSTVTPVPNPSSSPTVPPVPHSSSAPTATHSTVTPVPNPSSAPTVTPVPNPSSAPTATHSTVTPVPNPSSSPTVPPVPHSSSAPTATHSTVTPVPNPSSAPTATHSTVTPVPNPSSAPTVTPVPSSSSAPTATPVPHSTSVPAATTAPHTTPSPHKPTPIPSSTTSTQTSLGSSTAKPTTPPCQTSSPPRFPSPSSTTKPTPGGVPESPRPTSNGHINLQPEPGAGSRLSSCLVPVLAATLGNVLLWGLL